MPGWSNMAGKKKISIQEALKTLHEAGVDVTINNVEKPVNESPEFVVSEPGARTKKHKKAKETPGTKKVTLFTQHCIGSGGSMTHNGEDKQVIEAGVVTYGPGVCEVPVDLVGGLLHQDMLAKEQDDRMLDKTQRNYLVVQRRTGNSRSNVALRVDNSVLNSGINLNGIAESNMLRIQ